MILRDLKNKLWEKLEWPLVIVLSCTKLSYNKIALNRWIRIESHLSEWKSFNPNSRESHKHSSWSLIIIFEPGTEFPGNEKICYAMTKKYKNQAGMNIDITSEPSCRQPYSPCASTRAPRWHLCDTQRVKPSHRPTLILRLLLLLLLLL